MRKLLLPIFVVTFFIILAPVLASLAKGPKNQSENKGKPGKCTTIQSGELLASDGSVIETGYDQWGYNYQAHMFNGMYCDSYRDAAWCQPYKDVKLMMKWNDAWLANKDCDGDGLLDRHYGYASYIGSGAWLTNHQSGEYEQYNNIVGDWIVSVDYHTSKYNHDVIITDQDENGNLSGYGYYPSGGLYTIHWDLVNSSYKDDTVHLEFDYRNSDYVATLIGSIDIGGSMFGEWSSSTGQEGTWKTISGVANAETCKWNYFVKIVSAPSDAYVDGGYWYTADGVKIGEVIWGAFAIVQQVDNDPCAGSHGASYISPAGPGFGKYKP